MKIFAFSDTHGSKKALQSIKKNSKESELIMCLGDLTIFEQDLVKQLRFLNKLDKKVLIIPGNHESSRRLESACSRLSNLVFMDRQIFETEKIIVAGAEANGFSLDDPDFEKTARKFRKALKQKSKPFILMTHAPPHNTKLDELYDGHCGNKSIRRFIRQTKPVYAFSGHIHENHGKKDKIGSTTVINVGPGGVMVDI